MTGHMEGQELNLETCFKRIDVNGDGHLDRYESLAEQPSRMSMPNLLRFYDWRGWRFKEAFFVISRLDSKVAK